MKYLVSLVALTVPSLALAMGEVPQVAVKFVLNSGNGSARITILQTGAII